MTWLPRKDMRRRVQLECNNAEDSLTEQHHYPGVAIKSIMNKFRNAELEIYKQTSGAFYADMMSAPDFQEAQIAIARAEEQFMMLPSDIRSDMKNDPAVFLEFVSDEGNREKLVEYGFIEASEVQSQDDDGSAQLSQSSEPDTPPPSEQPSQSS